LLLTSCTMAPPYERPHVALPTEWPIPPNSESVNTEWWSQFGDIVLDAYIDEALQNNQDLKVAIARVDTFYARVGIVRSELYPQIEAPAGGGRERISKTAKDFIPAEPNLYDLYSFGLKGSLELDIWGKIRSASNEALAKLGSQVQVQRTVVLNLVTSVASTYVTLRALDKQLKIAQQTIDARYDAARIAKTRFSLGLTSYMQVEQAISELESAQVRANDIAIQITFGEDQLNFLIGRAHGTIHRGKLIDNFRMPPHIPSDIPSHLLTQRPDILAAEQNLIAANANIGVARAEFFPNFSLSGAAGFATSQFQNLVEQASGTWQYGFDILQAVFTGGRLTANLRMSKAQKREQLHNYVSTVLKACNQVNDALIDHKITLANLDTLRERVETVRGYFHLATLRYNEGQTDYLNFLDAERQLFNTELQYAQAQGEAYTTLIAIYAALGGGWVVESDAIASFSNQM